MHLKKYEWVGSPDIGDCSLWVRSAALEFDDGLWQCQVTASDFTTQDALASEPARLVVRGEFVDIFKPNHTRNPRRLSAISGDFIARSFDFWQSLRLLSAISRSFLAFVR